MDVQVNRLLCTFRAFYFIISVIITVILCNGSSLDVSSITSQSQDGFELLSVERYLAELEMARLVETINNVQREGYSIQGFYHTSTWQPFWSNVVTEQLLLLNGYRKFPTSTSSFEYETVDYGFYVWDLGARYASLLDVSDGLWVNVAITNNDMNSYEQVKALLKIVGASPDQNPKVQINYNHTIPRTAYNNSDSFQRRKFESDPYLSEGEYSTIEVLTNYCQRKHAAGEKAMVYYIHSKGGCCWKLAPMTGSNYYNPVADWRELMNAFILEFPSICVRAILEGYASCGVNQQVGHYSGNYWWADCEHIVRLPPLTDRFDYASPEFFISAVHWEEKITHFFGKLCGFSPYHSEINSYHHLTPRSSYLDILLTLVSEETLPSTYKFAESAAYVHVCKEWRRNTATYFQQSDDLKEYLSGLFRDQPNEFFL